jgi:acyl-CoA thioester hydrolase
VSRVQHRVAFYETDAMGIVHHANHVRYLELARVRWMDEHYRPYREFVASDRHFATTRVEVDYRRPLRFDEEVGIHVWLERVGGASLRMAYRLDCAGAVAATAATEHALVDTAGRVRRLSREDRARLGALAAAPGRGH